MGHISARSSRAVIAPLGAPGRQGIQGVQGTQGPPGPGTGAGAWQPNTAYTANQVLQAPDGSLIYRISNGTSRATFDSTEKALWGAVSSKTGTIESDAQKAAQGQQLATDGTPAQVAAAAIAAAAVAAAAPIRNDLIEDLVNSWWSYPTAVHDRGTLRDFITGSSYGGSVGPAWWSRRSGTTGKKVLNNEYVENDDHYTRAMICRTELPMVVFGSFHGQKPYVYIDRTKTPGEFTMMENTVTVDTSTGGGKAGNPSYGSLLEKGNDLNTIAGLFRTGAATAGPTLVIRSTDRGATPSAHMYVFDRPYFMPRRGAGGVYHCLAITHPTQSTVQCHYFRMDATAGLPTKASGADARNPTFASSTFWNFAGNLTTPFIDVTSMDNVRQPSGANTQRIFDMTGDGRMIAICDFTNKVDMSAGGTYKVLVRQTNDATNNWAEETLVASGDAFYDASGYVGGMIFTAEGDVILCRRPTGGPDVAELWRRTGTAFGSGTWAKVRTIYTAPDATWRLVRPNVFLDCNDYSLLPSVVTLGEYVKVDRTDFRKNYGNQRRLEYDAA